MSDPPARVFSEAEIRGVNLIRAGRSEEAAVVLRDAVAQEPEVYRLRIWLADALLDIGGEAEIPALLESIPEGAPDCERRHWRHAEALYVLGDFVHAEAQYRKALEVEPESPLCWTGLGYCRARLGSREDAVDALRRAFSIAPGDRNACAGLYSNLFALERLDEAAIVARRWTEVSPNEADAWNALGCSVADADEAKRCYLRALELDPEHPLARENLEQL